ncbi:small heat shock protein, chloroplastic-like [Musa acuminata AAA Group]|uniref:small heat shock protein, chloroplastic-like n=1 Tax=Musa acuminata AAA Group TaxID=214697 RepID=UPI0031DE8D39
MPSTISNPNSVSLLPLSSRGRGSSTLGHRFLALHGVRQSPLGAPRNLAVKAMVPDGRDSLDHLQRAGKVRQQQEPQRHAPRRGVAPSAPLGLWDRFPTARTVQQMMETMERIMDDPLGYSVTSSPSVGGEEFGGGYRRGRTPWEIKEGEGVYKMRFDMPGMTKNDVKVWVEERMLVIKAEKLPKEIKEGEEEEWSAKSYGRYNSRIALPDTIDLEKIKAEVKDGVLYVTIPKASPSSKVVDISVQ